MLNIRKFYFNPFVENTYLVYDSDTGDACIIDPGMVTEKEEEEIDKFISDNNLKLTQIVNTHLHLDHCFGNTYVHTKYGALVKANSKDAFLGAKIAEQAARFGMGMDADEKVGIDVELKQGDIINVGKHVFHVLEVPGHSPGSIALYCPEYKLVFVGDVLFEGSIGRTDLEGGDYDTLINSIKDKLFVLPDDTNVLPGHGDFTTIGHEKVSNPYF